MHYTGQVYRHPMEANTPLLEVTIGCSHNKCSFCTMYRETRFGVSPMKHIEEDLQELRTVYGPDLKRIYLVNADPFVYTAEKLANIAKLIISYFPNIETITGYASIQNLKNKTLEEWKMLRELRINDLHIGLETAYDPALKMMNKGFTQEEAYEQLKKIREAGIDYDALIMMGIAGKGNSEINIKETTALLNETKPYMVSVMPTSVTPGSELEAIEAKGEFTVPTELEMIEEQKMLIQALNLEKAYLFASHNYSLIPVSGSLKYKEQLIAHMDKRMEEFDEELLNGTKIRGAL